MYVALSPGCVLASSYYFKGVIIKSSEHSCSCKDAPKTKVRKVGGGGEGERDNGYPS